MDYLIAGIRSLVLALGLVGAILIGYAFYH
jgi:hypothetical protein